MDNQVTLEGNGITKPKKLRGTVTRNASVVAIAKISAILDGLESDQLRADVLEFTNSQYGAK